MKWTKILKKYKGERVGLLTNQSAYGTMIPYTYNFQFYEKTLGLHTVFLPEHGLFAELQDQVSGSGLKYSLSDWNIVNLYGDSEDTLTASRESLKNLDLLIIDIRDVGARYYTFLTTAFYILQSVHKMKKSGENVPHIIAVDYPNPIGSKVEGSPLDEKYESFVGVRTALHRHGMSVFELLEYYRVKFDLDCTLDFISPSEKTEDYWVPPSPNIPTRSTCIVYPGQCLLEGTNLSEGRGTTRPFEMFGAPFINPFDDLLLHELNRENKGHYYLRPLFFQPVFHKHANRVCGGYQIIVNNEKKFHSLLFTLHLLRTLKDYYSTKFEYLQGPYEFRSDRPAVELLAGDDLLISYLYGKGKYSEIRGYLNVQERKWEKEKS